MNNSLMNRRHSRLNFIFLFLTLLTVPFVLSCSDDDKLEYGTIVFSSEHYFDFRIFDSAERLVSIGSYVVDNPEQVYQITLPVGVYSVFIDAAGLATMTKTVTLTAGEVGFLRIVITIEDWVNDSVVDITIDTNS